MIKPYAAGPFAHISTSDRLQSMRSQLDDLTRQLATGKRAETLGRLGPGRATSLSLRASLGQAETFASVIQRGETRAALMSGALDQITRIGSDARSDALAARGASGAVTPAAGQTGARARLDSTIAALNSDFDGQYLFSGSAATTRPVIAARDMLEGVAGASGINQMADERRRADAGNGLGRMTVVQAGSTITLSEEAAGLPFGLKLAGVVNGLGGAAAAVGGSPSALSVAFSGVPAQGEMLEIAVSLPDGTVERLRLKAGSTNGIGNFAIGADATATAANFSAALDTTLRDLVATKLAGASGIVAAQDFFDGSSNVPARRIAGPPFETATGFAAPGSVPTVLWYVGDDDPAVDPRETQSATVDRGVTLAVGARANETPLRAVLAGLAALAAGPEQSIGAFQATADRAAALLPAMGTAAGREIVTEIGIARQGMAQARERHAQVGAVMTAALGAVEDAPLEEVSVAILSLQTRLEASYQVTASLGRLSLADYLG